MAAVETNVNQHLRKKYFVDADSILSRKKSAEVPVTENACRVFAGSQVRMAKTVRRVCGPVASGDSSRIDVHLVKNGSRIEQIRITCPCGRHAELDCRYEGEEAPKPGTGNGAERERGAA
jgi:hypothetical protein